MIRFITFVNNLDIADNLKEDLKDTVLLKESHRFYLSLFEYLTPLFPDVDCIEELTFASYLHFRFLLIVDNYIDAKKDTGAATVENLFVAFELYERSTRELSVVIRNDDFWTTFRKLKQRYFGTLKKEKLVSLKKPIYSIQLFNEIATGKSALCHTAVAALESVGGIHPKRNEIIQCLDHIHIAFQLIDDIDDFKKDIKEGQWTYIRSALDVYLKENNISKASDDLKFKILFSSGLVEESIRRASEHYQQAINIAKRLELHELKKYILSQKKQVMTFDREVKFLKEKTIKKLQKSKVIRSSNSISDAIKTGSNYLYSHLGKHGMWEDFYTSAGEGSIWTTAYVACQLGVNPSNRNTFESLLHSINNSEGSYNEHIFQDGDSMNFIIGLNQIIYKNIPADQLSKWLNFMNDNGGWTTYRDKEKLRERLELDNDIGVEGWTTAHPCVSAVAAYVLSTLGEPFTEQYRKTCAYLTSVKNNEGYWESYWWTSPMYATTYSIMALRASEEFKDECESAAQWIVENQMPNGAWSDAISDDESTFYTALAIKALNSLDAIRYEREIKNGTHYLIQHQTEDGSWQSTRILRIPATNITDPNQVRHWRKSSFGVNCIVDDHNRFFTTATIVNSLRIVNETIPAITP